jgi:predicted DNA-binding protein
MTTGRENGQSKLVSVRLTFQMIEDLKKVGDKLGRPYQNVMKEAIEKGLPIVRDVGEVVVKLRKDARVSSAVNIQAAMAKLRKVKAAVAED